jgi:serine/threonine-protein kinase PpkA
MKIAGYNIESQIGNGGMAVVYRAIQTSLDRPVALKVMHPLFADSPEFTERFLNEGRLLASLRHSNIMTIYDIGVSDGLHYISMEYVDGGDLRQRIGHGMPLQTALDYVITLGSCLKAAHAAQIVHRDVKPANILFRLDGTLLLTDFGIAKRLAHPHGLTATGSMMGSPYYISPEQALGRAIDGKADIYSLGIVFYEMLVGEKPFQGDSEVEVALKHIEAQLPPLPQHLSQAQPLLERMTAKKPAERFHDAASMLQAAQCLRDTGRWQDVATVLPALRTIAAREDTLILPAIHHGAAVSAPAGTSAVGVMLPPDTRNSGGRFGWLPRKVLVGKRGLLMLGIGMLVLTVGMVASRLAGSKDEVMPTVETGPPQTSMAAQAHMAPQLPMDMQPPLDTPVAMDLPAVTDTQTPADSQAPTDTPAPPGSPAHLEELLRAAHTALTAYRLTTPDTDSAYYYYQQVLAFDPHNRRATAGFSLIAERYLALARKAFDKGQETKARQYVALGLSMQNDQPELLAFHQRLASQERHSDARHEPDTTAASDTRDEPGTTATSDTRDEPPEPRNVGASVGKFFRNVARLFAEGAPRAPDTTADSLFPRRDGS